MFLKHLRFNEFFYLFSLSKQIRNNSYLFSKVCLTNLFTRFLEKHWKILLLQLIFFSFCFITSIQNKKPPKIVKILGNIASNMTDCSIQQYECIFLFCYQYPCVSKHPSTGFFFTLQGSIFCLALCTKMLLCSPFQHPNLVCIGNKIIQNYTVYKFILYKCIKNLTAKFFQFNMQHLLDQKIRITHHLYKNNLKHIYLNVIIIILQRF
eukprot:TRINITY_DN8852_c1_g1_i8.p1 TRINITY_DN8852_c1_g1~~TRINITY_DN8852_c1_g1_i8.p1  ORF type:complete len:208 (-),score=-21.90 TRINITY_DN8852_c1_g1_i8:60-683(-)